MGENPSARTVAVVYWIAKPFYALSAADLYDVMALRETVFVVEQQCPYLDADGLDPRCWHLLGRAAGDELAAYLRVVPPGLRFPDVSIGRFVVARRFRGTGLGRELGVEGLRLVETLYPGSTVRLAAQVQAAEFYARLGFVRTGEPFLEDGIPHIEMYR